MTQTRVTYDWLEDALLGVCRGVFTDATLRIENLAPRMHRVFPHLEYAFTLTSDDAQTDIVLRLQYGFFSLWEGTEPLKITKEYSAMRHVYQSGLATPFPYTFSPSRRPFGRPFILMDAGDGYFWWEREDSLAHMQEHVVDTLASWMAQMHLQTPTTHPLIPTVHITDLFDKIEPRIAPLKDKQLNECFMKCKRQMANINDYEYVMLHGRLDLDSLLINRGQVRCVTNWEYAAIGDPRWDAAYTSLSLQRINDRTLANYFIARYVQEIGEPLEDLSFWEGAVALREYALCRWLRSLDAKGFESIAGLQTQLFDQEDWLRERTYQHFLG